MSFIIKINALSRFYDDSDIIALYNKTLKAEDPTIIDLVGTTRDGKTTFVSNLLMNKARKEKILLEIFC